MYHESFSFAVQERKSVNSLPNNKILDRSKLKAFADDKINATEKLRCVSEKIENILGKRENTAFSPFSKIFSKASFLRVVKSRDCVVKSLTIMICKFDSEHWSYTV